MDKALAAIELIVFMAPAVCDAPGLLVPVQRCLCRACRAGLPVLVGLGFQSLCVGAQLLQPLLGQLLQLGDATVGGCRILGLGGGFQRAGQLTQGGQAEAACRAPRSCAWRRRASHWRAWAASVMRATRRSQS